MEQPLLNRVRELKESGADFAYFCSFGDRERLIGEESLYLTDEKPYLFKDNARYALDETIPQFLKEMKPECSRVPVFTSFGLVTETLGIRSRHEASWPKVGMIRPSQVVMGKFTRDMHNSGYHVERNVELQDFQRRKLEKSISGIVERIRDGEALQVVLSQHFELEEFNGADILEHLIHNDRSRYVYYYKMGEMEIIGSSPENVFRRKGQQISINPIAGTRKRNTDSDQNLIDSLLNDNKELCEHRMLVDLARNDLARISRPGSVNVRQNMVPEKFYSVIHLTSTVEAEFAERSSNFGIFASLFPAGTVSGAPKIRAIELIDRYESRERGAYGGAIGLVGADSIEMALTIRSAFMRKGKAYTQAGAGIVKDSVPEKEVEEIIAKAGTIMAGGLICA